MADQSSDPCSHELTFEPECKASQPAFQSPFSHFGHTDIEFSNHMIPQMSPVNWRFSVAKGHFQTSMLSFSPLKLDFPNPGPYNHLNIFLHLKRDHAKNCLLHTSKHLFPQTPSHTARAHPPMARVNPRCAAHPPAPALPIEALASPVYLYPHALGYWQSTSFSTSGL